MFPEGSRDQGRSRNQAAWMRRGCRGYSPCVCKSRVRGFPQSGSARTTSSLPRPQPTVTRQAEPTEIVTRGRHDPCLLPRFVPMGEAMVLLTLADHWLRHRAQCG